MCEPVLPSVEQRKCRGGRPLPLRTRRLPAVLLRGQAAPVYRACMSVTSPAPPPTQGPYGGPSWSGTEVARLSPVFRKRKSQFFFERWNVVPMKSHMKEQNRDPRAIRAELQDRQAAAQPDLAAVFAERPAVAALCRRAAAMIAPTGPAPNQEASHD